MADAADPYPDADFHFCGTWRWWRGDRAHLRVGGGLGACHLGGKEDGWLPGVVRQRSFAVCSDCTTFGETEGVLYSCLLSTVLRI